jgi:hypothetical protein
LDNQIEKNEMSGARGAYRVLERKSEGKTPLERHGHRWEDDTNMDLRVVGWRHELD